MDDELNENTEVLDQLYPEIRAQFDKYVHEKGISPMSVFGVYLGIIGQEFSEHATKEEFDNFLKKMMEVEWQPKTVQ
jgi:hypothetical protein